jgi:hypothetical protein
MNFQIQEEETTDLQLIFMHNEVDDALDIIYFRTSIIPDLPINHHEQYVTYLLSLPNTPLFVKIIFKMLLELVGVIIFPMVSTKW